MVSKRKVPEQFQIGFQFGGCVIKPQVTPDWAIELVKVQLVNSVCQATRICPLQDAGPAGNDWVVVEHKWL